MNKFSFWLRWLLVVGVTICIFGIIMAFLSGTVLFKPLNSQINPVFWDTKDVDGAVKGYQQWIMGVLGATMTSWGIFVLFIVHYPFRNKEKWSWNCLIAGLLVWFFIDNSISLYFRVYFNAIFNTILFVLVMLPLVFTRKCFVEMPDME
ncbi:hypothetical protein ACFL6S_34075 [Candidatus Poribacteria bacterium]